MSGYGDNSVDADRLRLLIERIENIGRDIDDLREDQKDVYLEAKAVGYDTKIIRQIVRLRKMKPEDLIENRHLLGTYAAALGLDLI